MKINSISKGKGHLEHAFSRGSLPIATAKAKLEEDIVLNEQGHSAKRTGSPKNSGKQEIVGLVFIKPLSSFHGSKNC
jgi:hypothetical protein